MKQFNLIYIVFTLLCTVSCQSSAQEKTPDAVKETFKKKYPGENDPDWHTDKNGNFESNFKINGDHYRADFKPNGQWIETEQSIKTKKLPKVIEDIIEKKYKDYKIVEVEKVDHYQKGVFYDVEFKKDKKKMDVEFDENGNILN